MLKPILFATLAAALASGAGYASQNKSQVVIPVQRIPASNGKQMYIGYCAPCHGVDGRGQGPVAVALRRQPVDLTSLSKNNGGRFPATHVIAVLEYGSTIPSHGNAQMPVWGPVLSTMDQGLPDERGLRITNLARFLETIQVK
jgi:mono/diheme cytochrome c family protein